MTETNVIVSSPKVEGNVGKIEINVTDVSIDSFHTRTIAVNSATGEVLSDKTYFDWGILFLVAVPLIILIPLFILMFNESI